VKITWQLVLGTGASSKIIAWWGAGGFSHIDVVTPRDHLRGARSDVIKGIPAGYRDRPQNYERWAKQVRFTLEVTNEQYVKYWQFSDAHLGDPYDERGLFMAFLLGHRHKLRDPRNKWVGWCSQEVARNGEYAGIWTIPPQKTNIEPGDCAMIFTGAKAHYEKLK
jgi:hypothetical protein